MPIGRHLYANFIVPSADFFLFGNVDHPFGIFTEGLSSHSTSQVALIYSNRTQISDVNWFHSIWNQSFFQSDFFLLLLFFQFIRTFQTHFHIEPFQFHLICPLFSWTIPLVFSQHTEFVPNFFHFPIFFYVHLYFNRYDCSRCRPKSIFSSKRKFDSVLMNRSWLV